MNRAESRAARKWATPLGNPPNDDTRAAICKLLRDAADAVEAREAVVDAYTVAVVLLGQEDGAAFCTPTTLSQSHLVESILSETYRSCFWKRPKRDVVANDLARRFVSKQLERAYEEGHPWICKLDSCIRYEQRFATERGLRQHQARARWHQNARRAGTEPERIF